MGLAPRPNHINIKIPKILDFRTPIFYTGSLIYWKTENSLDLFDIKKTLTIKNCVQVLIYFRILMLV